MEIFQERIKELEQLILDIAVHQKEFLTVEDLQKYLQLSKSRIHKLTSGNEIPHYKPGG